MNIQVIYDGSIFGNAENVSEPFSNAQFLYFDTSLGENYEVELGVSFVIEVPAIGGNKFKLAQTLGTLNTNELIPVPREISESEFTLRLAFGVDATFSGFRAYAITSEVTQEGIGHDVTQIKADIELLLQNQTTAFNLNAAIAANQLAQNTALSILGTGLSPISAGVTAGVVPILSASPILPLLP